MTPLARPAPLRPSLALAVLLLACSGDSDPARTDTSSTGGAAGAPGAGQGGSSGTSGQAQAGAAGAPIAGASGAAGSTTTAGAAGSAGTAGDAGSGGVVCPANGGPAIVLGTPCDSDGALCGSCDAWHTTQYRCDKGLWIKADCANHGLAALDAIDCGTGAACLAGSSCSWFQQGGMACTCGSSSTMECSPGSDVFPDSCTEGSTCTGSGSYCVVRDVDCGRKCTCEDGTYHCESRCNSAVCATDDYCQPGDTCDLPLGVGDCTRSCTCPSNGYLGCQIICPSCGGASLPTCDEPCETPTSASSCLCQLGDSKIPCHCGASSTGELRRLCCPWSAQKGTSCEGFPEGKVCAITAGADSFGTSTCKDGVWSDSSP